MNITVLGATGRTGTPLVAELLRRGHTITALVRDPAKLDPVAARIRVVTGDSTDPEALRRALDGTEAVLSALGPTSKEPDLHTRTAQALITVMPTRGVRRFVGISGAGIDVPGDRKGTRDKIISRLIQRLGGAMAADKRGEYQTLAASDLDWTLVPTPPGRRPGHRADHPRRPHPGALQLQLHPTFRSRRVPRRRPRPAPVPPAGTVRVHFEVSGS